MYEWWRFGAQSAVCYRRHGAHTIGGDDELVRCRVDDGFTGHVDRLQSSITTILHIYYVHMVCRVSDESGLKLTDACQC